MYYHNIDKTITGILIIIQWNIHIRLELVYQSSVYE